MKDYRRILEVSADATEEQIKAQYKRLVRIYHPDRFANADDKLYVEQKLQEINEAYRFLLHPAPNTFTTDSGAPVPQPIALPAILDFGELVWGKQQTLVFHVENSGGVAQSLQLEYSDVDGWFKVTKGRRLYPHQPFPMEFAVVVDTARLEVGKSYQGWIQVKMDNAATQVALAVRVVAKQPLSLLSPRLALMTSAIALLLIVGIVQLFDPSLFLGLRSLALRTQSDPVASSSAPAGTNPLAIAVTTPELTVQPLVPTTPEVQAVAVVISPVPTTVVIQARSAISAVQAQASPLAEVTRPLSTATATALPQAGLSPTTEKGIVTPSPRPSSTVRPQPTPTPTLNSSFAAAKALVEPGTLLISVPDNYYVNGRADTLVESAVLQILPSGSQWVAIGRTADADWLLLQVDQEQLAWVSTPSVIVIDDVMVLPVIKVTNNGD